MKAFLALVLALFVTARPLSAEHAPLRPVDLNTATVTELMQLPRIGARTAERIVKFRKEHGAYRRIEEVMNVQGIGEKSFVRLRPYLAVSHAAPVEKSASARR